METVKSGDLYFVSDDKDYYSVLDKDRFNKFLFNEWETTNGTEIRWFRTLSEFCKSNFPDIAITSEKEKESIINELISSSSFADSKGLVRKLIKFDNFSSKQINDIANAFVSNLQLHWIKGDYPINEPITLIKSNRGKLDDSIRENFVRRLEEPQPF